VQKSNFLLQTLRFLLSLLGESRSDKGEQLETLDL